VELPLAFPVIVGGFRTAVLQVIATATLGAILSGGGLGRFLWDGMRRNDPGMLFTGALLVAALAISVDLGLAALQRAVTPRGVRVTLGEERRP
jgi:osmoprotectant transport system permease protein